MYHIVLVNGSSGDYIKIVKDYPFMATW